MQQRIFTALAVLLCGLVLVSGAFAGAEGEAAAARASTMEPGPYASTTRRSTSLSSTT